MAIRPLDPAVLLDSLRAAFTLGKRESQHAESHFVPVLPTINARSVARTVRLLNNIDDRLADASEDEALILTNERDALLRTLLDLNVDERLIAAVEIVLAALDDCR